MPISACSWTKARGESYGMLVDNDVFAAAPYDHVAVQTALHRPARPGYAVIRWMIGCGEDDTPRFASAERFSRELGEQSRFVSYAGGHEWPDEATERRCVTWLAEQLMAAAN